MNPAPIMKSDNERIEAFLKGVVLPEYESDGHAQQLRAQILSRLQAGRAGRGTSSWWKTAALLVGLLGAAALATETIIQVRHYYFYGRPKDAFYYFSTTPENAGTNQVDSIGILVRGGLDAAGIEQKRKDLEEIDALRQRNARELCRVIYTEVNGKSSYRLFYYKYVLADGRTEIMGDESPSPAQSEADRQQIADLRQRGQREITGIIEVGVGGQSRRSLCCRYLLSDGRRVTRFETDPELPGPVPLTFAQESELVRLSVLEKKGEFLGSTQVQVLGRTFSLQHYSFTLSDGTVVTRAEGQSEGPKNDLTAADSNELYQLAAANKGETLGTYDEDVNGKPFKFTRVKYVLSDGTEVIQSTGKPDGAR
jgi:hypothetical protein